MKLIQALFVAFLVIFAFNGCANPFLTNVYNKIGLGGQSLPELSSSGDILGALSKSDAFVGKLTPAQVEEVKKTLKSSVQGSVDNRQEQEAVLALSKVSVKSSGADEVVKNTNNLIGKILAREAPAEGSGSGSGDPSDPGDGSGDPSDPGEMFKEPTKLLGELFGDDPASVKTQIKGLVESAEALNSYGKSLADNDAPPSVTKAKAGELASTALVSGIVSTMVDIHPEARKNPEKAVSDLASFLADPAKDSPYKDGSIPLPKPAGKNPKQILTAFIGRKPALADVIGANLNLDALAKKFASGGEVTHDSE